MGSARPLPVPDITWYPTSFAMLVEGDTVVNKPDPIEFNIPPTRMKGR